MTAGHFVALLLFLILVFVYWSPYVIAMHRKSDKSIAIALTLFFFGLTVVGWIIALIWAVGLPKQLKPAVLEAGDADSSFQAASHSRAILNRRRVIWPRVRKRPGQD